MTAALRILGLISIDKNAHCDRLNNQHSTPSLEGSEGSSRSVWGLTSSNALSSACIRSLVVTRYLATASFGLKHAEFVRVERLVCTRNVVATHSCDWYHTRYAVVRRSLRSRRGSIKPGARGAWAMGPGSLIARLALSWISSNSLGAILM